VEPTSVSRPSKALLKILLVILQKELLMSLNSRIFNDLGVGEFSVWANINPELDPGRWAQLCRRIGSMSQRDFTLILALVNAHKCLRYAQRGHIQSKLGIEGSRANGSVNRQGMPILSVGPSGIGGEYQRERG